MNRSEYIKRDKEILRQSLPYLMGARRNAINDLEVQASRIKKLIDESPTEIISLLARRFSFVALYQDSSSIELLKNLDMEAIESKMTGLLDLVSVVRKLHNSTEFYFPITYILDKYLEFTYLYFVIAISDSFAGPKNSNKKFIIHELKEEINRLMKQKRDRRNKFGLVEFKPHDFGKIFYAHIEAKCNQFIKSTDLKKSLSASEIKSKFDPNKNIESTIKKGATKPEKITYKELYYDLKKINQELLGLDFHKADFAVAFFDLFKVISFENYSGSKLDYSQKKDSTEQPISKPYQVKRFKYHVIRDFTGDR
ncbi:MAG: hypothetical protein WDZ35_11270 [Crocinitomicaceae bacterium]